MKRTKMFLLLMPILFAITLTACGGGGGRDGGDGGGGTTPTLASITVTPANTSFYRGASKQFTATGNYSDGSTQNLTLLVSWGSSDASVATISSTGLAAANSNKSGPTTITATSGSISGSAQLMVSVNLPKTGQTKCYDTTTNAETPCSNTSGQDGNLQKGVAEPSPRFTNPDGSTPISGNVVVDQLTGLMWTQDAGTPTVGTCTGGVRTWQDALNYVACLNTNNYLGYSDWRLPNRKELRSLINYGQANTATWLIGQGFSNVQASYYWSSSTRAFYAFPTTNAWSVNMGNGFLESNNKANTVYVWPVRAGQ